MFSDTNTFSTVAESSRSSPAPWGAVGSSLPPAQPRQGPPQSIPPAQEASGSRPQGGALGILPPAVHLGLDGGRAAAGLDGGKYSIPKNRLQGRPVPLIHGPPLRRQPPASQLHPCSATCHSTASSSTLQFHRQSLLLRSNSCHRTGKYGQIITSLPIYT